LASKRNQGATEETSSGNPSQEELAAVPGPSKGQVQPVSASTRNRNMSEAEGEKYLYGDGVPADCERAQQDLLAAAEHSSAKAESTLGTMYATGHCTIRDLPLAYRWFARAQRQTPRNRIIEEDIKALWDQMSPEEKKLAKR
jgi:TPR repeat protein